MRTLYVSDLDGTLLNDNQTVNAETAGILNDLIDRGLPFTIATARSWESTRDLMKGIHLKLPVVLINGVFIYDTGLSKHLRANYLPRERGERIIRAYLEAGLNPLMYTVDRDGQSRIYYRGVFNPSEAHYIVNRLSGGDARFRLVDSYEECLDESIITINAIDVPERLQATNDRFKQDAACICHYGPDIYTPGYHWLEIASYLATKREAVLDLKARYGFDRLVCFGDNLNDLPMFEAADEKYAVRNAHELVKLAADRLIGSNNENGVPRFLQSAFSQSGPYPFNRRSI
ncbi:HAD family hydrolase [Paenibacillus sp. R14(2021)]|uniref:HAD family hydrolase n=1 Tax=Paenibacillus sp. R14(2021) TaxID=2859228 RepID=UPI001C61139E|nr:HAD family hydrolase [Paenibacillus sp. R14(2021)]